MWRRIEDLNLWSPCGLCGFRNRRIRPTLPILHMAPREGLEPSPLSQIRNLALSPVELPGHMAWGEGLEPSNAAWRHPRSRRAGYHYRIPTYLYL